MREFKVSTKNCFLLWDTIYDQLLGEPLVLKYHLKIKQREHGEIQRMALLCTRCCPSETHTILSLKPFDAISKGYEVSRSHSTIRIDPL